MKSGVKYKNGEGESSVEAIVLLIGSFAKNYIENKYYSLYKTAYAECEFSPLADEIAEHLDKEGLTELLKSLAYDNGKAYFLPYCRYASE